ncbi:MAG TPA: hypothetical protein VGI82_13680 [Chitinophagaceae bacterium]
MKELTACLLAFFGFFICSGQDSKSPSDLTSDSYKRVYFDQASNKIDTLSGLKILEDSGYIRPQNLPDTSAVLKLIDYFKFRISKLDSADLKRGHSFNVFPVKFSDSIFFKNTYYYKEGQILKIENVISVPNFTNKALIYYSNGEPFKIFWAFTKSPYLVLFVFYYFDGKNISDNDREDFKAFSPFEYRRAIDLSEGFKKQIVQ